MVAAEMARRAWGGYVAEELTISWEPQGQDDLQPF